MHQQLEQARPQTARQGEECQVGFVLLQEKDSYIIRANISFGMSSTPPAI